jgi:uracil-DNA glycosylase
VADSKTEFLKIVSLNQEKINIKINKYQRKIWRNYKSEIGLPENYCYLYGNPIKVHVPLDTAPNGLMIIGAYPTAHFNVIGSETNVPVEDHLYPFSNEIYFDGSSINTVKSGSEIEEYFLKKLNINRNDCWITDLVKVFLFKKGHIEKYRRLGNTIQSETRSEFNNFAKKSKIYINEEIQLATPKVIIGLGTEVNSIMLDKGEKGATLLMSNSEMVNYSLNGIDYPYFPLPHPGILMRNTQGTINWRDTLNKSLLSVKKFL